MDRLQQLTRSETPVELPDFAPEELERRAIDDDAQLAKDNRDRREAAREAYEDRCERRGEAPDDYAYGPGSVYQHRVAVNYLRHRHTSYDWICNVELCARDGDDELCGVAKKCLAVYRGKVLRAIAEKHPHLAAECARQGGAR